MAKSHVISKQIFPSLLSADSMSLGDEIEMLIAEGIQTVHLDVMDNHYVPNLTFGPSIARDIRRRFPTLEIDTHLMVTPVDTLIDAFAKSGVNRISIHPDATIHLDRSLSLIRAHGCQAGLVFNPTTSIDVLTWCHHHLDFVLIMTVNPGFGGQVLLSNIIPKIKQIHDTYPALRLCVDGGITVDNIAQLANAGASEFVVGSGLFSEKNYGKTLTLFNQILHS